MIRESERESERERENFGDKNQYGLLAGQISAEFRLEWTFDRARVIIKNEKMNK